MLDRILIGSSSEPTDTNFKNVTLLLHGDGSNGAQNNTFIDSSTNNFTITRNGNTTQGSFSPYGSNWSNYFDGSGDYLSAPSNTALDCGTGDFTIECWVYISTRTNSYPLIFGNNRGSWTTDALALTNSNADSGGIYADRFVFGWNNGGFSSVSYGTSQLLVANATNSNNTWYHFAVVRNGTSIKMYRNGVEVASATISSGASFNWGYNGALVGGGNWDGAASYFNGYISNLRLLKGTALYTAAFTPSTTPLTAITNTSLLTCAYNRFRDGSTNNFTITRNGDVKVTNFAPFAPSSAYSTSANGGSAYFAGNEDFLTSPDNAAVQLGSGNFTIEMWVYFSAAMMADQQVLLFNGSNANSYGPYKLFYNGANNLKLYGSTNGSSWDIFNGLDVITTVVSDCWYHIALVRSGSTFSAYANGVRQSTASVSGSLVSTGTPVRIGAADAFGSYNFLGFISNFRMVKGTAVYDPSQTTLTVPTSPVTAITNTSLLLNATNAAIFDNSMKNDLETVGNAQISTSVKKFGTGSIAFDGNGDYLYFPYPTEYFNPTSWTIEGWVYINSLASAVGIFGYSDLIITRITSSAIRIEYRNNPSSPTWMINESSYTFSTGTWYHIAFVLNNGSFRTYVDGTAVGSASTGVSAGAKGGTGPANLIIGATDQSPFNTVDTFLNGYMDEVRITTGLARYTANFTAPTAPFPNK